MKKTSVLAAALSLGICAGMLNVPVFAGTPQENAQITRDILSGKLTGPMRNTVLMNAGAAIYIGGKADSFEAGVARAAELIESGEAIRKLDRFITESRKFA